MVRQTVVVGGCRCPCCTPDTMLLLALPGTVSDLFFSVAPDPLVPPGWTRDQDAITDAMGAAEEFIHVEVRSCRVFGVPLQHPVGQQPFTSLAMCPCGVPGHGLCSSCHLYVCCAWLTAVDIVCYMW